MKTVCIFGDSIAFGYNAPSEEGWTHHLKKFLEERDTEITVINCAEEGSTSKGVLVRVEKECEKHAPEEIIIAVGLNDGAYSFTEHRSLVSHEQFEKNIRDILTIAQKYAKKILVLGILRVDERGSTFSGSKNIVYQYQNTVIQKYNNSLREIALSLGAHFIDLYSILSDDDLDDGFHPNASGHQKIFEEVKKVF